jgi:hypothetical protein
MTSFFYNNIFLFYTVGYESLVNSESTIQVTYGGTNIKIVGGISNCIIKRFEKFKNSTSINILVHLLRHRTTAI